MGPDPQFFSQMEVRIHFHIRNREYTFRCGLNWIVSEACWYYLAVEHNFNMHFDILLVFELIIEGLKRQEGKWRRGASLSNERIS